MANIRSIKDPGEIIGTLFRLGSNSNEKITLQKPEVIIGRNPKADITIESLNVSRKHCILSLTPDGWTIKDNKSINGTYADGCRLKPNKTYLLQDASIIYLGPPSKDTVGFGFVASAEDEEVQFLYPKDQGEKAASRVGIGEIQQNIDDKDETFCPLSSIPNLLNPAQKRKASTEKENLIPVNPKKKSCKAEDSEVSLKEGVSAKFSQENIEPVVKNLSQTDSPVSSSECYEIEKNDQSSHIDEDNVDYDIPSLPCNPDITAAPSPTENESCTNRDVKDSSSLLKVNNCSNMTERNILDLIAEFESEDSQSLLLESQLLLGSDPCHQEGVLHPKEQHDSNEKNKDSGEGSLECLKKELEKVVEKQKTDIEELRDEVFRLQAKCSDVEHANKELTKDCERIPSLAEKLAEAKKINESYKTSEHTIKNEMTNQFIKKLEEELLCNICTEYLIKATVLGCSHTFCEFCIKEWKKKRKQCPVCRKQIITETRSLVIDNFIEKSLEYLTPNCREKRKEVIQKREEVPQVTPRRRKKTRARRRIRSPVRDEVDDVEILEPSISSDLQSYVDLITEAINTAADSDSDASIDGYGFYGGYGRCYTCGRRGHWAHGCPN